MYVGGFLFLVRYLFLVWFHFPSNNAPNVVKSYFVYISRISIAFRTSKRTIGSISLDNEKYIGRTENIHHGKQKAQNSSSNNHNHYRNSLHMHTCRVVSQLARFRS